MDTNLHGSTGEARRTTTQLRSVARIVGGEFVRAGSGVANIVTIGGEVLPSLDPFLLLADFGGESPAEYRGGFPRHPHRGFETVTFMVEGSLRHEDSRGNAGQLGPGAVQRMKAARGVYHAEMPDQDEGPLRGLQLWVNLPASQKMDRPAYQDIQAADVPVLVGDGVSVAVLVGGGFGLDSVIPGGATGLIFYDIQLEPKAHLRVALPPAHTSAAYVLDGRVRIADRTIEALDLAVLNQGDSVVLSSEAGGRVAVLAGTPLHEPVVRYGPFVMNTDDEISEALADLRNGAFE